jgi:hypothetical protein
MMKQIAGQSIYLIFIILLFHFLGKRILGFGFAMDRVRDNLSTFSKLGGGRMRGSSFVRKSRSAAPNPDDGPHLV